MYCSKCGSVLPENANFCKNCGNDLTSQSSNTVDQQPLPLENQSTNPAGFSSRISDPSFNRYRKHSKSWSIIFAFILAVIATIAFPIYGKATGELEMPYSLFYGLGIGGMFIVIALMQILKAGLDTTWDGVVIDKKTYKRVQHDKDSGSTIHYIEYVFKVKRENGKVYKHRTHDQPGLYNYYNIGDRVRHHKGFYYYEKYDKSGDSQILCAACLTMNDIHDDNCRRCKCPLLK